MRDPLLVEMLNGTQKVLAELLQHREIEGTFTTQLLRERDVASTLHREAVKFPKLVKFCRADDLGPVQPFEEFKFSLDASVEIHAARYLENGSMTLTLNQESHSRGSLAEQANNLESIFELAADRCPQRIDAVDLGVGQLLLDQVETSEELVNVIAKRNVAVGAKLNEVHQRFHRTIK